MTEFLKPATVNQIWSVSGSNSKPLDSKIAGGWVAEIPPYQWFNWILNRSDSFDAHVNQHGIVAWDATTAYMNAKSYVQGSNGIVYRAVADNTNIDPVGDTSHVNWIQAFDASGFAYSKSAGDARYAQLSNNLSDLPNAVTARTNLVVYSKTEVDNKTLQATTAVQGTALIADDTAAQSYSNDTKIITSLRLNDALKGANQNLATTGYQKLPGGLIMQWGRNTGSASGTTVTFPIAFPTACFVVNATNTAATGADASAAITAASITTTQFNIFMNDNSGHRADDFMWFAVGY